MKLEINKKDSFCLPKKELTRALEGADEADLKVLLVLCSRTQDGSFETQDIRSECASIAGVSESDFDNSIAYWRGARVLKLKKNTGKSEESTAGKTNNKSLLEDKLPDYTEKEMSDKIEATKGLKKVIDECQQIVGKIFSSADVSVIVGLSDRLGLSGEYITMLAAYCMGIGKKSLRYIEKTACAIYDEGIDTPEKLADYIEKKESVHENLSKIKKMVGAKERELTTKEEKLINTWLDDYGLDLELIKLAYEISVSRVESGGGYIPYMGGIIDNWHQKGLRDAKAIKEMHTAYKKSKEESTGGFDATDFFDKAVNRTKNKKKKQTV
ncbi:MAG: hypothetical protein E7635_05575 [Ruminococcaceae bacterium]|nr:hypothetical protein [Oscillospiraceae bacterium]